MGVYFQGILQGGSAPGRVWIHGRSASRGDWADPPLDTTGYAQREGGTHPTRMHSCFTPHGGWISPCVNWPSMGLISSCIKSPSMGWILHSHMVWVYARWDLRVTEVILHSLIFSVFAEWVNKWMADFLKHPSSWALGKKDYCQR